MTSTKTPAFMKDASGFCYAYTDILAKQPQLTPHDGDVDAHGFATDGTKPAPAPKAAKAKKDAAAVTDPVPEPTPPADPLDAALADAKLD